MHSAQECTALRCAALPRPRICLRVCPLRRASCSGPHSRRRGSNARADERGEGNRDSARVDRPTRHGHSTCNEERLWPLACLFFFSFFVSSKLTPSKEKQNMIEISFDNGSASFHSQPCRHVIDAGNFAERLFSDFLFKGHADVMRLILCRDNVVKIE
jgi:hypothetical protein